MLLTIAKKSLINRSLSSFLLWLSLLVSVFLVLAIFHLKQQARENFNQTISGIDLIVSARSGPLNTLLYSVFHMGSASHNMSWASAEKISTHPSVKFSIPLSLGDSHQGYPVLGTTADYFTYYHYARQQPLRLQHGKVFTNNKEVVLGAEVAKQLGYTLNDKITLTHGTHAVSLHHHDDKPLIVVGILKPTGTPVDRTLHVSLSAIEDIHENWQQGVPLPKKMSKHIPSHNHEKTPQAITAMLIGLKNKPSVFVVQRFVNQYASEPLQAIMPAVVLAELWQLVKGFEQVLMAIACLVVFTALIGLTASILASLNERQREFAVLRAVGAGPWYLVRLIELEVLLIALAAFIGATLLLLAFIFIGNNYLAQFLGMQVSFAIFHLEYFYVLLGLMVTAFLLTLIPAWKTYKQSLNQGLTVR